MLVIPKKIQIDIITGICNIDCIMCNVNDLKIKKIMDFDVFEDIVSSLERYKESFEQITLVGVGEPLLDKKVVDKITLLKSKSFTGIGLYTNGTLLDETFTDTILFAGLDSLIVSIDSINEETYSKIRQGGRIEDVLKNVLSFRDRRNALGAHTKIIIRFTKQDLNKNEYPAFLKYWQNELNFTLGDLVLCYDVHNFGGNKETSSLVSSNISIKCPEVFDRLYIRVDGEVGLCCGDINYQERIGSIIENDVVELYNNDIFNRYRDFMQNGRLHELELCKNCTIAHSIISKKSFGLE